MNNLKFIGVTDERDSCDCCGKTGLKKVVVFENSNGEFEFRGSSCALKQNKFLGKNVIKKASRDLDTFNKKALAPWSEAFKTLTMIKKTLG
jgi:hypothetical protein